MSATMSSAQPKRSILIQLDVDPQPSVFDAVVAVDAGVDVILPYSGVRPEAVRDLVYGAIFTRGVDDLRRTAIFIGGSDVARAEAVLQQVLKTFFGPMRVSVMLDPNGANTTAAAAVQAAATHVTLSGSRALVLASTGPVGQRVVQLLATQGAEVVAASRFIERAGHLAETVATKVPGARVYPVSTGDTAQTAQAAEGCQIVIAAGAPGVTVMSADLRRQVGTLQVAVDLNAVSPPGLEGVEVTDRGTDREGMKCYGAIGVGGTKMKLHKAALQKLFTSNDLVLDVAEIFALGSFAQL